jgi:hypothetical protein
MAGRTRIQADRIDDLLITRCCPMCGTDNGSTLLYKRNYDLKELRKELFSARRLKTHAHSEHNDFRTCSRCGLVYSSPYIKPEIVNKLYGQGKFFYGKEIQNLKKTYGMYLRRASRYLRTRDRILDVGAGNGFFLEEALAQGWRGRERHRAWGRCCKIRRPENQE